MSRQILACFVCLAYVGLSLPVPNHLTASEQSTVQVPDQRLIQIPVRVVNAEGEPLAGVTISPWALRSSRGHGSWNEKATGHKLPPDSTTDEEGIARVTYPYYAHTEEHVRTSQVTISLDHREYAHVSHEDINVPYEGGEKPHEVVLPRGVTVEVEPIQDGRPADLENLYVLWSDGRSWKPAVVPQVISSRKLRIPPLPAGQGSLLLVRLVDGHATHFSRIDTFTGQAGETLDLHLELAPAVRITGHVSDNVPRPIKNGRAKYASFKKQNNSFAEVDWFSWVPIAPDGTFIIESWPAGETLQMIALCDEYVAKSGAPPAEIEPRKDDPFQRPQVFLPDQYAQEITLEMEPMVRCEVQVVDHRDQPVAEATISSCPNVGWWGTGPQIYCHPLVRSEELVVKRRYLSLVDPKEPYPFEVVTDSRGRAKLLLPSGREDLYVDHDHFELPVNRGWRDVPFQLVIGETTHARLELQPKGTEFLGEWDKLAGVLFGCTGEQCRRLLSDEGFRSRIEKVRLRYSESDDPADPVLLKDAYAEIADAFKELGDQQEAKLWKRKAADQAKKLEEEKR
jgi:hypothetical protein